MKGNCVHLACSRLLEALGEGDSVQRLARQDTPRGKGRGTKAVAERVREPSRPHLEWPMRPIVHRCLGSSEEEQKHPVPGKKAFGLVSPAERRTSCPARVSTLVRRPRYRAFPHL